MSLRLAALRSVMIVATLALVGCGETVEIDHEAEFDEEVESRWKEKWPWVDAVSHFQKGGFYMDASDGEGPKYDKPNVVPLLKSLSAEFALSWKAVVHRKEQKMTLALVAPLPDDPTLRERIEVALKRHQETFPGAILVQWGHRWLSLDFFTPEQEAFLHEAREEASQK